MKTFTLLGLLFIAGLSYGQQDHFEYNAEKWPENTVVHYVKSNWDGTHQSNISVYFKDGEWIESLKWQEGSSQVTIVPAKIDHSTFSVHHFKNITCIDGECRQRGEMVKDKATGHYLLNFGPFQDTITNIPEYWHSYDFDWASLMVAFLFKKEHASYQFERCDFFIKDGEPGFGPFDTITMDYKGLQTKLKNPHHLYIIDGPGLNHEGGEIWFSANQSLLLGFKIKTPDEDSYQNVDFRFIEMEKMKPSDWEAFKRSKWQR